MGLRKENDDDYHAFSDYSYEEDEDPAKLSHKRRVRKMVEERLERKRLKQELDELDGDFDWDEFDR